MQNLKSSLSGHLRGKTTNPWGYHRAAYEVCAFCYTQAQGPWWPFDPRSSGSKMK